MSKSARELSLIAEEPVLPPRRDMHAGSSCRQLGTKKQLTPRQTGSHPKGRSRKDSPSKIPNQSKGNILFSHHKSPARCGAKSRFQGGVWHEGALSVKSHIELYSGG